MMRLAIADCRLPIGDWRLAIGDYEPVALVFQSAIDNRQSKIGEHIGERRWETSCKTFVMPFECF